MLLLPLSLYSKVVNDKYINVMAPSFCTLVFIFSLHNLRKVIAKNSTSTIVLVVQLIADTGLVDVSSFKAQTNQFFLTG